MKSVIGVLAISSTLGLCLPSVAQDRYKNLTEEEAAKVWIEEIVPYIATKQEKEVYKRLTTSAERVAFIDTFWERRDPTPGTEDNEYQLEHYRRLTFANTFFGAGRPGWMTDRGRIYILLGPPDQIDSDPMGRLAHQFPTEVWIYNRPPHPMLPPNMEIAFVDRRSIGDYEITFNLLADSDSTRRTEALMNEDFLDAFAKMEVRSMNFGRPGTRTSITDGLDPELERMNELALIAQVPERAVQPLREVVTTDFSFNTATLEVEPRIEFFRASDGELTIPVNLDLAYRNFAYVEKGDFYESRFEILGRLVDQGGNSVDEFVREEMFALPKDQVATLQDDTVLYQMVLYAPPGSYRLQLAVRDQNGRVRLTETDLTIPEIGEALELSSILLAEQILELENPTIPGKKEPFTFGKYKVLPSQDGTFEPGASLQVYFEAYNLGLDGEGKTRVKLEYTFRREGRL
ncbi:MAG TPA: GWxTD domain-containing protein, partial [Vicinamibacteria bacterium]|nr:GWxTD domain-containing protein [Vicinamibacteria bacterium]